MSSTVRFLASILACLILPATGSASKLLVLNDGNAVIYATKDNLLQRWNKGESEPDWSVDVGGTRSDLRSHIALLQNLGKNRFVVVERFKDVSIVHAADPNTAISKFPLFGRIKLKGNFGEFDILDWPKHIAALDRVAAATMGSDGRLYLSSLFEADVISVDVEKLFDQDGEIVRISTDFRFSFKDDNFIMQVAGGSIEYASDHTFPADDPGEQTALAVCGNTIIAGTSTGMLYFFPTDSSRSDEARIRELVHQESSSRLIIDAGCLDGGLAFSVALQPDNGQVQLWDVREAVMLDSVDTGGTTNLITFQATSSNDGKRLLAVGDTQLRVWSIEGRKLELLGKQAVNNVKSSYSAGASPNGGFIVADSERFWTLSADGRSLAWFAGKRP